MKCIFLVAIFAFVNSQQSHSTLNVLAALNTRSDSSEECAKLHNINYNQLMHAPASSWPQFNSANHKKYFLCVVEHMGFINEEGNLLKDKIRKSLCNMACSIPGAQSAIDDMIEECAVDKTSPEETAYNFVTCAANYSRGRH